MGPSQLPEGNYSSSGFKQVDPVLSNFLRESTKFVGESSSTPSATNQEKKRITEESELLKDFSPSSDRGKRSRNSEDELLESALHAAVEQSVRWEL